MVVNKMNVHYYQQTELAAPAVVFSSTERTQRGTKLLQAEQCCAITC
jgi:hypothetical protein